MLTKLRTLLVVGLLLGFGASASAQVTVDAFQNWNTADPDGTTITNTIITAGTQFGSGAFSCGGTSNPLVGMTINAHGLDRLSPTIVTGVGTFAANSTTRTIKLDNTATGLWVECDVTSSTVFKFSIGGYVTLGAVNIAPSGNLWDLWRIDNTVGHHAILQFNNGNCNGASVYGVAIETDPGGVTTHSTCIALTPGATYWFSLAMNFHTPFQAQLDVYLAGVHQGVAVTAAVDSTGGASSNVFAIKIGNAEFGTDTGTFTTFQDMMWDTTNGQTPLPPGTVGGAPSRTLLHVGKVVLHEELQ